MQAVDYPAHVILRFEIERALISGEIEADDIPALWAAKMQEYLGVDVKDNFDNGCLQDIHWPSGMLAISPATRWAPCMQPNTSQLSVNFTPTWTPA